MTDLRTRLRPTLGDFLGVFLVAAVVLLGARRLFGDSDAATHVATGDRILRHGAIPSADPFSGTFAGAPWFAYEWLADVAFALAHAAAGWAGLAALAAALIATAHVALYRLLVRAGGDPLTAFVVVLAAAGAASSHWLARPHLFTVLLLVVWVAILEDVLAGRRGPAALVVLPATAVAWANLHGGFLVGIPVLACYAAGELAAVRLEPGREGALRRAGLVAAVSVACALAFLVNPWGPRMIAHLAGFALAPPALDDFAPAAADRAGIALFVFLGLAALGTAAAVAARRLGRAGSLPFRPGAVAAFVVTAILALRSIRHVEVVSVLGSVLAAGGISAWLAARREAEARREAIAWSERESGGGATFALAVVAAGALAFAGWPAWAGYDPGRFPVSMVQRLRAEGIAPSGPVFSRDLWGGYLILHWPEARVFVDGRWDMYGARFAREYAALWNAAPGWEDGLEARGVTWAVLPAAAPLVPALRASPQWEPWAADATAIVFHRADVDPPGPSGVDTSAQPPERSDGQMPISR